MTFSHPTISIYIHWPFCLSKCPYCDFNSHVHQEVDTQLWEKALLMESHTLCKRLPAATHLESIYFGGGTPSLMPPATVEKLITQLTHHFSYTKDLEITLEANPSTAEQKRFQAFHQAGVGRLSIGIQSFDDHHLKFLGRHHRAVEAEKTLELANKLFPRFSFDLMYGLKDQSVDQWSGQLEKAATFNPEHISCYQLTFEKGTPFYTRFKRQELQYPEETDAIVFDTITKKFWQEKGLQRYEVSNYAKLGFESIHNLAYWRRKPTLGIGPGAHGRPVLDGTPYAEVTARAPQTWLKQVFEHGHGLVSSTPLSAGEQFTEFILMGLRLQQGLNWDDVRQKTNNVVDSEQIAAKWAQLKHTGFMQQHPTHLRLTHKGLLCLNRVVSFILDAIDNTSQAS